MKESKDTQKQFTAPPMHFTPDGQKPPVPKLDALFKIFGKYTWIPLVIILILVCIYEYRAYKDSLTPLPEASELQILFMDVGQADAALLICDGQTMLIDGGNVGDGQKIYSVLKERKIQTLDYVVCTHAHEDHVGGLSSALSACDAGTIFCPVKDFDSRAFQNFAEKAEDITVPEAGDTFTFGNGTVEILACDPYAEEVNNTSIVLKLTYGQTSFLFTGDAEYPVEQTLLDEGYDPSATVLKVGHHGSASSTSYRFLNQVMPRYAIISVGDDNSYGHPETEVLTRLRDADVAVYRTDLVGDILCTSDGKQVTISIP